jgi:hypothetical protein
MAALGSEGAVASSILALQAAHALLTAGVFWVFQRRFGNPVLGYWSYGWVALAAQLGGLAVILTMAGRVAPTSATYTAAVAFTLVGGYLKVAWLVLGAFEIAMRRQVPRPMLRGVIASAVAVALVSVLPFAGAADPMPRFLARQGTMGVLVGTCQLAVGIALWIRTTRLLGVQSLRGMNPPGAGVGSGSSPSRSWRSAGSRS